MRASTTMEDGDPAGHLLTPRSDRGSAGVNRQLLELVGRERRLDEVSRALRTWVQALRAPVVGAMHLTCSDESEHECAEDFQRNFVRYLLPSRKLSTKSAFASATLGGRYQWGAVAIAEDHFAQARGAEDWKVLLVKANAHVAVDETDCEPTFGRMMRYDAKSVHCGALHAALAGSTLPFVRDLCEDLSMEAVDRLGELDDPRLVDPHFRSLFVAVASARLQARRIVIDLQEHRSAGPTLYLVVPCVTINRAHHDGEMVVGLYACDHRAGAIRTEYTGLGDRPRSYRAAWERGTITVTDDQVGVVRPARDHRAEVLEAFRETHAGSERDWHPRLKELVRETRGASAHLRGGPMAKAALATLLAASLELAPVPAAVVLFGSGLVRVHHAAAAHRLARDARQDETARRMLEDLRASIDELTPEQAWHLTTLLLEAYGHPDESVESPARG
jgi:hypothetical protein